MHHSRLRKPARKAAHYSGQPLQGKAAPWHWDAASGALGIQRRLDAEIAHGV